MDDNPVLDIAITTYRNRTPGFVGTDNRMGADKNTRAYSHITDNDRRRMDIRRRTDPGPFQRTPPGKVNTSSATAVRNLQAFRVQGSM